MTDSRKVLSLDVGKLTDPGKIRHHLVDSLGFYKPDEPDLLYSKGELFLVADGIGGQELGAQAARLATDLIIKNYFNKSEETNPETALRHVFNLANMRIFEKNKESAGHIQAGTSLTCVVIQRGTLHVAHIGNSRLYLIKGNKIKQLTHDHVSRGDANLPPEMRKTGSKFEVSRNLGRDAGVEIEYFSQSLKPNDCLLLCTDGLFQVLDNQEIGRIALKHSSQNACEQFIANANERGGPDNITTILIKINGLITISESFSQTLDAGINLINPTTSQTPPVDHRSGATFRIGTFSKEIEEEQPYEVELITPRPKIEEPIEPESVPSPRPIIPREPVTRTESDEEIAPAPADKKTSPRVQTPRPLFDETDEDDSPKIEFTPSHQSTLGMRRRRNILEPKKSLDYAKLLKGTFLALLLLALLVSVGYLLRHDGGVDAEKPVADTETGEITALPVDSLPETLPDSVLTSMNVTVQAGTGKTIVEPVAPLKLILVNGNRLSNSTVQRLKKALNAPEMGPIILESETIVPSKGSHTRIIYRVPENGNANYVRSIAEKIQQAIKINYKKEIEITHCDISLILGKDLRMGSLKNQNLRRKVLEKTQLSALHLEILNGAGKVGLGGRIEDTLRDLIIDEKNYLQIIDVGNAAQFNYSNTILKCRPSKVAQASKIATILGLPNTTECIVSDDLADIRLVLGRDFNF